MKVYKSSILSLPVKSCRECQNRVAKRFKSGERYYSEWVCAAIREPVEHAVIKGFTEKYPAHSFPSVMEQMQGGGYHRDCPLEDMEVDR